MITARAFTGKHYAVLGLARSGLATVAALVAGGARVTAWDSNPEAVEKLRSSRAQSRDVGAKELVSTSLDTNGLNFADLDKADLTQFDSIVVTPGLPLNRHPIAQRARDAGVEIIGDIELFARARTELPPHKVVGITGTNGKSTTTALVHHILQTAGVPSLMGGNIGLPILSQDPLPEGGVYVLELSSYQIDLTKTLDCDVAVLLNITPDHLDRYENFEAYAASKARLFEMQSTNSDAIVGVTGAATRKIADDCSARGQDVVQIGTDPISTEYVWPALQGPHNAQNAAAAVEVCVQLGLRGEAILSGLRTFPGLPHRMERIRDRDGVLFVNDSKATNAEAAAPALAAYPRVRWIVGGKAKSDTIGQTGDHLDHVVTAYTIGEAGPMFARLLRDAGVTVIECETLENAVKRAAEDSQAGETVLLSPASASFDQYRDFEARGDHFRDLVGAL
ncbi:UDP-N-acetylmuramoyl-L-alanine--D-glutamate ligase [Sphingomonas sp.]|uniref:UDP-N-acetylmuramoyl-L-alanine--D-glutamate ligase n=1 Tax=Sphingomonas sp. TaxID=28214 RepID=UPI00286C322E|nr:UDP-N-acetylmuramoyl-L-alanine--D-glutamate ligase [Sphingomonas sp.]